MKDDYKMLLEGALADFHSPRTYLAGIMLLMGNVVFPQLCHLVPYCSLVLQPIYFFTLIAAYSYGFAVGLIVALLSPLLNWLLFSMPALLSVVMIKSLILLVVAVIVSRKVSQQPSWLALIAIVATYQVLGIAVEWGITAALMPSLWHFALALPGMAIQVLLAHYLITHKSLYSPE